MRELRIASRWVAVASAAALLSPGAVHAATLYAAPTGAGALCAPSVPCALQAALDQAVAGDTVLAGDGTYNGPFYVRTSSGTATAPILLQAQHRLQAAINGNG